MLSSNNTKLDLSQVGESLDSINTKISTLDEINSKLDNLGIELSGNATEGDVISGKTFYNTDAKTQVTGTLTLSGNATEEDVLYGKTFYNTDAKTIITGTLKTTGVCVTTSISNFGLSGGSTVTKSTDVPIGTYGYIQITGSCGNTSAVNTSNCTVTIMDGSTSLGSGTFTRDRQSTASFTVRIAKQFTTTNNISVKFYNSDYNNWSNISIYYVKI